MRSTIEPTGLTRRIIPCLDVAAGRVVKGVQFKNLTDHGDPTEAAARYAAEGADEIVFLDITAAPERRDTDLDWVRRTAEQVFIPLSVGGGVRSVEDGRKLLLAGADKLGINTAAVAEPELLTRLAERFGSQCVVLSVDAKRREPAGADGAGAPGAGRRGELGAPASSPAAAAGGLSELGPDGSADGPHWEVVTHGGRTPTGLDALEWIEEGIERGAGEILLTSIDSDGTKEGYDLELLRRASALSPVPVIASGGAGTLEHLADALETGAAAVLAASIFHQETYSVGAVKEYLDRRYPMRIA